MIDDGDQTTVGQRPTPGPDGTPTRPGGMPLGAALAALLIVVVAFGAGLVVGGSRPGGPRTGGIAPTASAAAPGTSEAPTPGPTSVPTAGRTEPAATGGAAPTETPRAETPPPTAPPVTPAPTPAATPGSTTPVATIPPFAPDDVGLLFEALQLIRERYVGRLELDDTELTYGTIAGLVEALGDTGHSVFLTPDELAAEREALEGRLVGIGALLGERAGRPIIVSVISGAPADRAGIRAGDVIVEIDGAPAERLSLEQIGRRVRGEEGTTVTLRVLHRGDDAPVDVPIVRERIEVDPASWAFIPGTDLADVRLIQFSRGAAEQLRGALGEALDAGATGIVLDLRGNPGGLVNEAVTIVSQFLGGGTVYLREDADGNRTPVAVEPGGIATGIPLAVLVDAGSASSAEITAGALQDAARGPVIGVRTFGTGTVLNTFELSDGSAVRLGVERWLTPSGRLIFDEGIEPTEVVELPVEGRPLEPRDLAEMSADELAASGDSQLLRAVELLAP